MKILLSNLIFLFFCIPSYGKQIRIAILDTGYNTINYSFNLCPNKEEFDFTNTGMKDFIGHGNNVTHIIANSLKDIDYCIIPIKVIGSINDTSSAKNIITALQIIDYLNVDVVNMSFVGDDPILEERLAIEHLQAKGVIFVAAAGNDNINLDVSCRAYPMCYNENIIGVGNWEKRNLKEKHSNYGKRIKYWQLGTDIAAGGMTLSGTSQACAKQTSKIARQLYINNSKLGK